MARTKQPPVNHADTLAARLLECAADLPAWVREYGFSTKGDWKFDFAWPIQRVAVEVNGGQWLRYGGRHNRDSDRRKMNRAAAEGWRVLVVTPEMMRDRLPAFLADLREALRWKAG